MPARGPRCFSADIIARWGRNCTLPKLARSQAVPVDNRDGIGNTRAMSEQEPQPRRTIGSIVAIALVVLILLLLGEVAGVGLRAWLDWWRGLP
jgi:hypothetical protein